MASSLHAECSDPPVDNAAEEDIGFGWLHEEKAPDGHDGKGEDAKGDAKEEDWSELLAFDFSPVRADVVSVCWSNREGLVRVSKLSYAIVSCSHGDCRKGMQHAVVACSL